MTQRTPDYDAVARTIQLYIEGSRTADVSLLKQAFHPDAHLAGMLVGEPLIGPIGMFYDVVASNPSPADEEVDYQARIASIEIYGDVACAVLIEDGYAGLDFINHFQLIKLEGEWRIIAKLFQSDMPES